MKKIIAANWKMNKTKDDAIRWFNILHKNTQQLHDEVEVLLFPPILYADHLQQCATERKSKIKIGVQNLSQYEWGAYTGEVSAGMIKSIGCEHVIIGHSERRAYFGENNLVLTEKLSLAFKNHLTPIFCIGESLEERNNNKVLEVLETQLSVIKNVHQLSRFYIAYEPVWAIGTGKIPTQNEIAETHAFIKKLMHTWFAPISSEIPILYGGSFHEKNASSILSIHDVSGALIGGASLDESKFSEIITIASSKKEYV